MHLYVLEPHLLDKHVSQSQMLSSTTWNNAAQKLCHIRYRSIIQSSTSWR